MNRKRPEEGFSITALIVFVMALSVGMAAVAPNYQLQAQRELEEELIFRGEEYVRAIQKYQRRFGVYPPTVDALLDTNGIGFLRRAYLDPITGDEFRLLTATPTGGIEGSVLYSDSSIGLFEGRSRGADPAGSGLSFSSQPGGDGQGRATTNRDGNGFGEPPSSGFQQGFGESPGFDGPRQGNGVGFGGADFQGGFGGARGFGSGASEGFAGAPGQGRQGPSTGAGPGSGFESGRSLEFGPQSGTGLGGAFGFPQGESNSESSRGGPASPTSASGGEAAPSIGLSGIVGVAPTNNAPSLKVYNGREVYMEWEFIALPRGFGGSSGDGPTSTQTPALD